MAFVVKDRVQETTATTGTGTLSLAGAVAGFQAFSAIGDGNVTYYTIYDTNTGDWEVGFGTYTLSGATLTRTTVLSSSNAGALVSFAAGTKYVWCDYPAEQAVLLDNTGYAYVNSNLVNGITAQTVSTASGSAAGISNIPAGVKRVQMIMQNLSVTSTVIPYIQLGTGGVYQTTGYTGSAWYHSASGINGAATVTNGIRIVNTIAAATVSHGIFTIANIAGSNQWVIDGHIEGNAGLGGGGAGTVTLSGVLDSVQLTGATFDGGSITITYE